MRSDETTFPYIYAHQHVDLYTDREKCISPCSAELINQFLIITRARAHTRRDGKREPRLNIDEPPRRPISPFAAALALSISLYISIPCTPARLTASDANFERALSFSLSLRGSSAYSRFIYADRVCVFYAREINFKRMTTERLHLCITQYPGYTSGFLPVIGLFDDARSFDERRG